MKKFALVLALALVMTFAFCAVAFADHAPANYISWSNAGVNSNGPHADYQLTTTKCNVCHAVHRAAVPAEVITVSGSATTATANTQMLLRSSVANACNYCHMDTAVGGIRLWNGNSANYFEGVWTNNKFAHGNGCTGCHAVHGAKAFKGAIESKILRYDIKAAVVASETNPAAHTYAGPYGNVQTGIADEIFATNADLPTAVSAGSDKLFGTLAGTIEGSGLQTWTDTNMHNAQVTAFCTCCHSNYSSDSEVTINLDQDLALFGGSYTWVLDGATDNTWKHKNHPVTPVASVVDANNGTTLGFNAGGATVSTSTVVAWATASSCRACHDAGIQDAAAGVVVNSFPHVTPGYYRFMGRGSSEASYTSVGLVDNTTFFPTPGSFMDTPTQLSGTGPNMNDPAMNLNAAGTGFALTSQDGYCLKCHVQGGGPTDGGIGRTF